MRRMLAIARKELQHILRDPRSLGVALVLPLVMVLIFGYGIDTELRDLPLAILDHDHTPASRALVDAITASGFIRDAARPASRAQIEAGFRRGRFRAALIIPRGYAADRLRGPRAPVQILVDGADATTAATVDAYLRAGLARAHGADRSAPDAPLDGRLRIHFNPELISAHFIVPGLVAVVLIMMCALLTSVAIARERESGTLEQVLTTPVRPRELIIGKVLPYLLIACLDAALVLAAGRLVFHVPMEGSWWVLAGYSLLYLLIALALGLLISTVARTQRVATMLALIATLLPTILLSGFLFPFESMPPVLRALGHLVPATYYLEVIHGVLLTGRAWFPVPGGVMAAMTLVLLTLAVRRFRTRLE